MSKRKYGYLIRTCKKSDGKLLAHGGFEWPSKGRVEAPDWDPNPRCGHGLHGLLWGLGDASMYGCNDVDPTRPETAWLVVKVLLGDVVDLGGKVKVPSGEVVHVGDAVSATAYVWKRTPHMNKPLPYAHLSVGAEGVVHVGHYGHATAGYKGKATAGDWGCATAGEGGKATAGEGGKATAGYKGTATAGNWGKATAGEGGKATAGEGGIIFIQWYDSKTGILRITTGYVGEDGIEPNVTYRCDKQGRVAQFRG